MRSKNLLSLREAAKALIDLDPGFVTEYLKLKPQEVICLDEMCDILWDNGAGFRTLEGFYTNYIIPQIGKEFDLLRFGTESVTNQNTVINIELKSELGSFMLCLAFFGGVGLNCLRILYALSKAKLECMALAVVNHSNG